MSSLDKEFTATLQKSPSKGGWTYVVMPGSADFFGTRGLRQGAWHRRRKPVPELLHGVGRRHPQAPIEADLRASIAKEAGDTVTVRLEERLDH